MDQLLALDGRQFELAVVEFLRAKGYSDVRRVGGSGDLGVDITCRDASGSLVAVQCKRFAPDRLIGSPLIQVFFGMIVRRRAERGIYVTTSDYTRPARKLASELDIELIDGAALEQHYADIRERERQEQERRYLEQEHERQQREAQERERQEQERRYLEQEHEKQERETQEQSSSSWHWIQARKGFHPHLTVAWSAPLSDADPGVVTGVVAGKGLHPGAQIFVRVTYPTGGRTTYQVATVTSSGTVSYKYCCASGEYSSVVFSAIDTFGNVIAETHEPFVTASGCTKPARNLEQEQEQPHPLPISKQSGRSPYHGLGLSLEEEERERARSSRVSEAQASPVQAATVTEVQASPVQAATVTDEQREPNRLMIELYVIPLTLHSFGGVPAGVLAALRFREHQQLLAIVALIVVMCWGIALMIYNDDRGVVMTTSWAHLIRLVWFLGFAGCGALIYLIWKHAPIWVAIVAAWALIRTFMAILTTFTGGFDRTFSQGEGFGEAFTRKAQTALSWVGMGLFLYSIWWS